MSVGRGMTYMNEENKKNTQRSRDDPKKEKKKRKPSYLKDRETSSGVTFEC